MSRLREMHRKDLNHAELVAFARRQGIYWWDGPPLDGWAVMGGHHFPVEIKMPAREGRPDEFTAQQISYFNACRIANCRYLVWRKEADVLNDLKELG